MSSLQSLHETRNARSNAANRIAGLVVAILLFPAFCGTANAQTYTMDNTPVTTCLGFFTDSGGDTFHYGNNEDFVKTFTPDIPNGKLNLIVYFFIVELDDTLQIFDGNSTSAPLIGNYSDQSLFYAPSITSTAADGSLTFRFISNSASTERGWKIFLSCSTTTNGGACCQQDSCSVVANQSVCEYLSGGVYQGDDTICTQDTCPPFGACCRPYASTINRCSMGTEADCLAIGGAYQGDDVSCIIADLCTATCDTCPGDMNGDQLINGDDIQGFIDCYFYGYAHPPFVLCGCDDMSGNGSITGFDLSLFCTALVSGPSVCPGG